MSNYIKLSLIKYKYLQKLKKNSYFKRKEQKTLIQGEHQVNELLQNKPNIVEYLLVADKRKIVNTFKKPVFIIDRGMSYDLSVDSTPVDVAAIVNTKLLDNKLLDLPKGFYLGLVNVQDPFNIGSIFRTAESFDLQGILLMDNCVDPFNNKVIASSTGSVFRVPFLKIDSCVDFINKNKNLTIVGTDKSSKTNYFDKKIQNGVILFGNEGKGLPEHILNNTSYNIKIPIETINSLNISVSAGIICAFNKLEGKVVKSK